MLLLLFRFTTCFLRTDPMRLILFFVFFFGTFHLVMCSYRKDSFFLRLFLRLFLNHFDRLGLDSAAKWLSESEASIKRKKKPNYRRTSSRSFLINFNYESRLALFSPFLSGTRVVYQSLSAWYILAGWNLIEKWVANGNKISVRRYVWSASVRVYVVERGEEEKKLWMPISCRLKT